MFVVTNQSASQAIRDLADIITTNTSWFNGDDAVVLFKGSAVIDSLGQLGSDPGTEWGSGLTSTADNTIRRKGTVCGGDVIVNDAFNPHSNGMALRTTPSAASARTRPAAPLTSR